MGRSETNFDYAVTLPDPENPHFGANILLLSLKMPELHTPSFVAIGSGVLLPGVAENPTFPILRALAYTTGLGYRPTCDITRLLPLGLLAAL